MADEIISIPTVPVSFIDKYTTAEKLAAEPELEKDKLIVSTDTYATCELLDGIKVSLGVINFRLGRLK